MFRNIIGCLAFIILLSACSALSGQSSVALALKGSDQPFQSKVEIAKPTYTPSHQPTATSTAPSTQPPTLSYTIVPTETATPAVFADTDFVIVENNSLPSQYNPNQTYAPSVSPYLGNKYILVDISEQHMYVYEGNMLAFSFVASTGIGNSTRVGTFSVLDKIPNAYGATWNIWMPNWLGIYWSGYLENGIHALPILPNGATLWAGYLGMPISYGCVVLGTYEAQILYNWADVGTPVEIQW